VDYLYLFTFFPLQIEQVCVQIPTLAVNATLLAIAAERQPSTNRSMSPANRAHSSKPAAADAADERRDRRTDKTTDRKTLIM